jgi:hypothetical protein
MPIKGRVYICTNIHLFFLTFLIICLSKHYHHHYSLGGMMLFCIWDRNISHRQKVGILIGVTFQMFSGVIQVLIIYFLLLLILFLHLWLFCMETYNAKFLTPSFVICISKHHHHHHTGSGKQPC